jgi:hypothetical protein
VYAVFSIKKTLKILNIKEEAALAKEIKRKEKEVEDKKRLQH